MLHSAVERKFEIIGEATNQMLLLDPEMAQYITHARNIVGLRNRLIHGYDVVNPELIWAAITRNLPLLIHEVQDLLNQPE